MLTSECNILKNSYISDGGTRFDVLKLLLAILIVAMHSGIFPRWLLPLPRLAVPLFFMMSSYLFFLKQKKAVDSIDKKILLFKYVKRNALLYCFWSVVLLPSVIVLHQSWFQKGIYYALYCILKAFFITGFFPASWFILAACYSTVIVFYLSKRISNGWLFIIALFVYSFALLDSNYGGLLNEEVKVFLFKPGIRYSLNIPAAMIWVVLGKALADKPLSYSSRLMFVSLMIGLSLYCLEFLIIEHYGLSVHTDCFIMSVPLCFLIFVALGQSKDIHSNHALLYRKSSIIIYCIHLTFIRLITLVLSIFHVDLSKGVFFLVTLLICFGVAYLVIYLHEQKGVKVLNYAY